MRSFSRGGLPFFIVAGVFAAPASAQQELPPACTAPEHSQFDFWIGEWKVYRTGETTLRATSRIDRLHEGCVIREQWKPLQGGGGSSLNHYDPGQRRWHQTWIDSTNQRVVFEGGLVDGKMVLTGFWTNANGPGKHRLVRMTYGRNEDGSVRQFGQASGDHGVTWAPFFDLTYRPAQGAD